MGMGQINMPHEQPCKLASSSKSLIIPGLSDVGRERLSDILGEFSLPWTIPPELT